MKKFISFLLCIISIFSLCSCTIDNSADFTIGVLEQIKSLDPVQATNKTEKSLSVNCFEGFLRFDEEGKLNLAGATAYIIGKNALTYTFKLNPDAHFYLTKENKNAIKELGLKNFDTQITANDYIYGIERFLKNNQAALPNIKTIKAIDDFTLQIVLKKADHDLLYKLASFPIYPTRKEFCEKASENYGKTPSFILTNGAYFIKSVTPSEAVIEKNVKYNGNIQVMNKSVAFYTTGTIDALTRRFAEGSYDMIFSDNLRFDNDNVATFSSIHTTWGLAFNCKSALGKEATLRAALLGTVNYDEIPIPDFADEKATKIIPRNFTVGDLRYGDHAIEDITVAADIQKAKSNLTSYLKNKKIKSVDINFFVPEGFKSCAETISKKWSNDFGENVNVKITTFRLSDIQNILSEAKYDIVVAPLYNNYNTALSTLSAVNKAPCYYENKNYTALLNSPLLLQNGGVAVLQKAENHLAQNGVFFPVFHEKTRLFVSKNINGIYIADGGSYIYFHEGIKN